ncbi:MAG: hypothetical protein K1X66_02055 [Verrucomicrobiae bacterium]|nr:hypothetical protein [Verrucomicrobiae bacterium]
MWALIWEQLAMNGRVDEMPFLLGLGLGTMVLFFSFFLGSQKNEFYIWSCLKVLGLLLSLIARSDLVSLAAWVFAGILSWVLAVRFYYFFAASWLVVLGYQLLRFQPMFSMYVPPGFWVGLGSLFWLYGGAKAVSGRTIRQVCQGWLLGQLGFFILVSAKEFHVNLFYEVVVLGFLGEALVSILAQNTQRFGSIFLSEWEGKRSESKELGFFMSTGGLAIAFVYEGFVFWQSLGAIVGLGFLLGWLFLILSYWRVGQHLFVKRSLRLEAV